MERYWMIKDGQSVGPFAVEELSAQGLTPETKVWRKGLAAWTPAVELEELAGLFVPEVPEETAGSHAESPAAEIASVALRCPYSHLKGAIVATVVILAVFVGKPALDVWKDPFAILMALMGAASIVSAVRTRRSWNGGDIRKARRLSGKTAAWITLYVIAAIVALPFKMVAALFL